jgi:hypothetical protein
MRPGFGMGGGVRAARAARFGACAESFVHDLLDGADAAAALGAAAEASVHLTGRARRLRSADGISHVVVGEDVAGTNDHGMKAARWRDTISIWKTARRCKRKTPILKGFQTGQVELQDWNQSKETAAAEGLNGFLSVQDRNPSVRRQLR